MFAYAFEYINGTCKIIACMASQTELVAQILNDSPVPSMSCPGPPHMRLPSLSAPTCLPAVAITDENTESTHHNRHV